MNDVEDTTPVHESLTDTAPPNMPAEHDVNEVPETFAVDESVSATAPPQYKAEHALKSTLLTSTILLPVA